MILLIDAMPIMFVSGNREDELPALKAGANDFLKKPCDYDVMIARLGIPKISN
jgi:DNA-binding response OmpR family regulator